MGSSKYDIKKELKSLYKASKVNIVDIPAINYIAIKGEGNPNNDDFARCVEALYAVAYTLSMSYKNDFEIEGFYNFVVPPLEGEWDTISGAYGGDKDNLKYTLMIAVPEFVTGSILEKAKNLADKKKGNEKIIEVELINYKENKVCVALHKGSYDNEPETFEEMEKFTKENAYARKNKFHREIYLNDARKTEVDKLKTILVFNVE